MKKIVSVSVIVLLLVFSANLVLGADNPHLSLSLLSYSPVPAEPNSYITVNIQVQNDGDSKTSNAMVEFVDQFPFYVDDVSSKSKHIGVLGPEEDYLAQFRVRVDGDALEGDYHLKFRNSVDNTNWVEREIPLSVEANQKTVTINKVDISPELAAPGKNIDVSIKIKNLASANLRDVAVKLNLAGQLVGTEYMDLPFGPIGSSIEKRISSLNKGASSDFNFILQVYPTASAGIYKIPVTLSYTDESGASYSNIDLISVVVQGDIEIMSQIDSSSLFSDKEGGEVTFSLTNKGLDEVKFLTIKLDSSDEFKVSSPSDQVYLGNVESDDYETASFDVKLTNLGKSSVSFPIEVSFRDSLNNEHKLSEVLTLPLSSVSESGNKSSSTSIFVGVVVVVILVGIYFYRKKKNKKK